MTPVFEGFRLEYVEVGGVRLRVRSGGSGPANGIDSTHHLAENAPRELVTALRAFL